MLESTFQSELIKDLEEMFQGCIVLKNDTQYIQGFPDLTILYKDKYAVLECKRSRNEKRQPNQDYYICVIDKMSFARFIYPENKMEVLHDLQYAFKDRRASCIFKR